MSSASLAEVVRTMRERNDAHAKACGIDETGPRLVAARNSLVQIALSVGAEGALYQPGADRRRDAHVRALIVAAAAFADAARADEEQRADVARALAADAKAGEP